MTAIQILAETDDTVTLRRADFETMRDALEEAEDTLALKRAEVREQVESKEIARADHLPVEAVLRLMEGVHPVRVWRGHRGLTLQALAERAEVSRSYVAEIERRKKPGSVSAYRRLAQALGVSVDDLVETAGN